MHALGRLFRLFFCFLALIQALGGQWIGLQGIAWTQMLVQNSQHYTLKQSVTRTFDGKHPCAVCHRIQAGRSQERSKPQSTLPEFRSVELIFARAPSLEQITPDLEISFHPIGFKIPSPLTYPPLSPPPEKFEIKS